MLVIGIFLPLVGAIATALAKRLLQFGSHGANNPVAFTNGVHYGIIFTIILAIIRLAIAINNQNEVHH